MRKNKDTLPSSHAIGGVAYYNRFKTGQEFWEACTEHPDWMLWAHARSSCPVPWAYAALADIWAADADARYADARYAADAGYAAADAGYAAAAARYAADARYAAAAARYAADARKQQCDDIRAALPWFPGFSTKESV